MLILLYSVEVSWCLFDSNCNTVFTTRHSVWVYFYQFWPKLNFLLDSCPWCCSWHRNRETPGTTVLLSIPCTWLICLSWERKRDSMADLKHTWWHFIIKKFSQQNKEVSGLDLKQSEKFHVTMYDPSSVDEARLHLFALKREIIQLYSTNSGSNTRTGKGNCMSGKGTIKILKRICTLWQW